MPFLQLLLLRHAESLGNREGRMEGWQSTSLTETGWQQAAALGKRLLTNYSAPTHIYCSPLRRSVETLVGAAVELGWLPQEQPLQEWLESFSQENLDTAFRQVSIPLTWSDSLKEYQNGVFQGLTWSEAQQRYPNLCEQLETSLDWLPIPKAETLEMGRERAISFVEQVLTTHQNGDRIWVISHHWMLQQIWSGLLGCDRTWGFPIGHTALFEVWLDRQRWQDQTTNRWNSELWQIKRFNDCDHLKGF